MSSVSGTSICTSETNSEFHVPPNNLFANRSMWTFWVASLQEVVDPEDLLFLERIVDQGVELLEALQRLTVRLLVDRLGARVQAVCLDRLGRRRERGRRDGEVVDQVGAVAEGVPGGVDDVEQA